MTNIKLEKLKHLLQKKRGPILSERAKAKTSSAAKEIITFINTRLVREKKFASIDDVNTITFNWMKDRQFVDSFIKILDKHAPKKGKSKVTPHKARMILHSTLKGMLDVARNQPRGLIGKESCPQKTKPAFKTVIVSMLKSILISLPKEWTFGHEYYQSDDIRKVEKYYKTNLESKITLGVNNYKKNQGRKFYTDECIREMLKVKTYDLLDSFLSRIRAWEITRPKMPGATGGNNETRVMIKNNKTLKKEWMVTIPKSIETADDPSIAGPPAFKGDDQYSHLNLIQHGAFLGRLSLLLGTAALEDANFGSGTQFLPINGVFPEILYRGRDNQDHSGLGGEPGRRRAGTRQRDMPTLLDSSHKPWVFRTVEALLFLPSWGKWDSGQKKYVYKRSYHPFYGSNGWLKRKLALAFFALWRETGFGDIWLPKRNNNKKHYFELWDKSNFGDIRTYPSAGAGVSALGSNNNDKWGAPMKTKEICKNRSSLFTPTDYRGQQTHKVLFPDPENGIYPDEYCITDKNSSKCATERDYYRPLDAVRLIDLIIDMDFDNILEMSERLRDGAHRITIWDRDIATNWAGKTANSLLFDDDDKSLYTAAGKELELYKRILLLLYYWPKASDRMRGLNHISQGTSGPASVARALYKWRKILLDRRHGKTDWDITAKDLHTKDKDLGTLYLANALFHFATQTDHQSFVTNKGFDGGRTGAYSRDNATTNCQYIKKWRSAYRIQRSAGNSMKGRIPEAPQ